MPALIELGLVVEKQARWAGAKRGKMARFLTADDRELIWALGADEARD